MNTGITFSVAQLLTVASLVAIVVPAAFYMGRLTMRVDHLEKKYHGVREAMRELTSTVEQLAVFRCPYARGDEAGPAHPPHDPGSSL